MADGEGSGVILPGSWLGNVDALGICGALGGSLRF